MTAPTGGVSLVEVVVRVAPEHEEIALAHLLEYSPGGFRNDTLPDGTIEFGVYVPHDRAHAVTAYLQRAGVPVAGSDVAIVPHDYAERWKQFHNAITVGSLWVGPPWQVDDAPDDVKRVVIEPGQGFGTGAHATTRMMLELVQLQPRASMLDVGCGSGVLAIAAALLGFPHIIAIDNEQGAIESTTDNLRRNGVETLVDVRSLDATTDPLPRTDIALANLTLAPLQQLAPRIKSPKVLASGLLRSQVHAATAAFEAEGYVLRERRDRDGWVALVFDSADPGAVMRERDLF